jgi:hypothetical protein
MPSLVLRIAALAGADAEPIRGDEPRIEPTATCGVVGVRAGATAPSLSDRVSLKVQGLLNGKP